MDMSDYDYPFKLSDSEWRYAIICSTRVICYILLPANPVYLTRTPTNDPPPPPPQPSTWEKSPRGLSCIPPVHVFHLNRHSKEHRRLFR